MKRFGLLGAAALLIGTIATPASASGAYAPYEPGGGALLLDGSPGVPVANPKTGTVYVPIQCTTSSCSTPGHVVDVISTAKCNTKVTSDCRVIARAAVGKSPLAAAIDEKTDTVYTANGSGSVSVVNGAQCNARVTTGCGKPLATIKTGGFPVAAALDPKTHTLYVASPAGQVFVLDVARCNAVTTKGCSQPVKTIKDSLGPDAIAVAVATDTVYAANAGTGNGDTVSVIDGATCNGSTGTGCGRTPRTIKVGPNPFWDVVDQATDTIYVANNSDGTVSVINGATCNAKVTSGCGQTPPAVTTGAGASFVAVDKVLHSLFALNSNDDTLSVINTRTCQGSATSGCPKLAPAEQAAPNHGPGYTPFPNAFALIPQTSSLYLVNVGGASTLSVINPSRCNATDTSGCRHPAPSVPDPEFLVSADPATDTIYAGSPNLPQIDVINGATCHAGHLSGCAPVAKIPMAHPQANVGAVDEATHTLYASDPHSDTISVINTATCNATHTAGCTKAAPVITIGPGPGPPALDAATKTLYVPYGPKSNKVVVVNVAACNAENTTGCGQAPGLVRVGAGTNVLAVSAKTDTIYAPSTGIPFATGDTVAVINGATCNGTDHSGCGHLATTIKVGLGPFGVTVDDATHTVYVANNTNGDSPGTVSVINGATCNGSHTVGCKGHMPTVRVGRSPLLVAVDTRTNTIYVTDFSSAAVSVLNGARCDAAVTSGCREAARQQAVGSQPFGLSINQRTHTVYVTQPFFQAGSMSIFKAGR